MELHSQIYHPIVELKITGKLLTQLPGRGNIATITVISSKNCVGLLPNAIAEAFLLRAFFVLLLLSLFFPCWERYKDKPVSTASNASFSLD
jgi:hypothetical protein